MSSAPPKKNSAVLIVFLTVFIDLLGFGIVIPLLPLYAERYHPSPFQFGLLMSSYSLMQFLFAPILGRLSDRVGRRPVLLVSLLGTVIGYLIFAFAHTLTALFAARILDGITGGNIGTAQAVIADSTSREERSKGMGMVGMAFGLGFIFGPAIGGFAVRLGEAAPGLFAAALSFVAFLWTLFRLPETRPAGAPAGSWSLFSGKALARSFSLRGVGILILIGGVATTAFATFEVTFSQFLHGTFALGPSRVAWIFVIIGVTSATTQGVLIRRLIPRLGEEKLIALGTGLLGTGFLLLLFVRDVRSLIPVIVLLAFGSGLLNPSLSGLVSRRAPAEAQGEVLGSFQAVSSLGRIIGPFWGENVFLRFGPIGPYGTAALLEGAALTLSGIQLRRQNRSARGGVPDGSPPSSTSIPPITTSPSSTT
ncbi:MAG: MFS transporter, partial [Thermoanaerobaculia bacterium]